MITRHTASFRVMVVAVFGLTLFVMGYISSRFKPIRDLEVTWDSQNTAFYPPFPIRVDNYESRCPSVLQNMTRGHWRTRKLAKAESGALERVYHIALTQKGIPKSLQRPDGRCGNTGYEKVTPFIRAICNPTGKTPCCYNFKCVNKTESQCRCKNCWDIRQQIHAEVSTWMPSDPRCQPRGYSARQSCQLLNGGTILFLGDSLVRHIYTALLMTVRGNFKNGSLSPNTGRTWTSKCSGMNMFDGDKCSRFLDARPTNICGGRVTLSWKKHDFGRSWKELINDVIVGLTYHRTLFVVGIGIHEDYNSTKVKLEYLKPAFDKLRKIGILWPKILFVDMNAPGIIKSSDTQSKPQVLRFNRDMEKFLKVYKVPVLKTFNITEGVRSFDGTHYALGVNALKANILLNYIQELSDGGVW